MLKKPVTVLQFFLLASVTFCFPLRDTAFIDSLDLSGTWLFQEDPDDSGPTAGWFNAGWDRTGWRKVTVPGVWGKRPGQVSYPVPVGLNWYAKSVLVPRSWNQQILIVFLGAMYVTDVWVNGQYLGVHRGGYTPFSFEITRYVKPGRIAEIVVRVDNRLSEETVPSVHLGWQSFGGLYREVYLVHRPAVYLDNLATSVRIPEEGKCLLTVEALVINATGKEYQGVISGGIRAETTLVGLSRSHVNVKPGSSVPVKLQFSLENPRLWSPDDPYLHTLNLEWKYGPMQRISFPLGLREITIKNGFLYLNNKRLWLQGFGQHEEYPGYGPCLTEQLREKDLFLLKNIFHCNFLRPGHYPNHPLLYELCDRLGIIVFSEIPSWQIKKTFAESETAWRFWLKGQIEEMIKTLRNHASVCFWAVANEQHGTPNYNEQATALVHSLDRSRPVSIVFASTAELVYNHLVDILARNFHYGWYHSKSVYALRENLPLVLQSSSGKPILVAEQGALATAGKLDGGYGDQSRGSETYQDHVVRFGFQYTATSSEQICGICLWTLSDFHRGNTICAHGILDEKRQPKLLSYTAANLLRGKIRLFLCEENALCKADGFWKASVRYFNPEGLRMKNLTATWKIMRGFTELARGYFNFDVPGNRQAEIQTISFPVSGATPGVLHTCWVQLFDSQGQWLYTNSSPFDVSQASRPGLLKIQAKVSGESRETAYLLFNDIRVPVYPYVGLIIPLPPGDYPLVLKHPDYQEIQRTVKIVSGESTELLVDFGEKGGASLPEITGSRILVNARKGLFYNLP